MLLALDFNYTATHADFGVLDYVFTTVSASALLFLTPLTTSLSVGQIPYPALCNNYPDISTSTYACPTLSVLMLKPISHD